jgi:hypothetical protein
MIRIGKLSRFAVVLVAVAPLATVAATRHVSAATGVDAGDCTVVANPCKTITYAMSQAAAGNPGDAISVGPGTYHRLLGETFPIVVKSGVQLQSTAGALGTRIDASNAWTRVFNASGVNAATLIQGFYITGGFHQPAADLSNGRGGAILIDGQSAIAIRRNVFADNQARGFDGPGVVFTRGGDAFGGAIASFNSTPIIENNIFRANRVRGGNGFPRFDGSLGGNGGNAYGAALYVANAYGLGNAIVVNNTFFANVAEGGGGGSSSGSPFYTDKGGTGGSAGGTVESFGADTTNNIFVGNSVIAGKGGTATTPGPDGVVGSIALNVNGRGTVTNSLFFGNLPAAGSDSRGTSAVLLDPQFIQAPGNLRLGLASPALGSGTSVGAPALDFDGSNRPATPSIGAFDLAAGGSSPMALGFGAQSMGTSSSRTVTIANGGPGSVTVSNVWLTGSEFTRTHNCATLAPGESCAVNVVFTPPVAAGAINSTVPATELLTIMSNLADSPQTITLSGTGEKSLVSHYYGAILNRAPDASGKSYWESEAARLTGLAVDINETWYVMAGYFFNSAEYLAANKTDTQFVADLYNTFFNRAPDGGGSSYWVSQIQGGLPRDVVMFSFMFSPEFRSFTQGIFGNTASRPEVNMVVDFFRGILNRTPDTPSFQYWLGRMRAAQCAGAGAVYTEVDAISSAFIFNPEYGNRNRNSTQFVTDMYYSFLRRGGDAGGVNFWVGRIDSGALSADAVRKSFIATPEFGARVNAVIAAGCYTGP